MQQSPNPHSLLGGHEAARPRGGQRLLEALPGGGRAGRRGGGGAGLRRRTGRPPMPTDPGGEVGARRGQAPAGLRRRWSSLRRIEEHMATLAVDGRDIFLLDRAGRVVAAAAAAAARGRPRRPLSRRPPCPPMHGGALPDAAPGVQRPRPGRLVFGAYAGVPEIWASGWWSSGPSTRRCRRCGGWRCRPSSGSGSRAAWRR